MNYLDIVLALFLVYGAYNGFKKGLIIEIATLIALCLGIYGSILFSDQTAVYLQQEFEISDTYIPATAFIVTFILIVVSILILAKLLEKLIKIMALGLVNRISGAVLGMVKSVLFLSFIVMIIGYFDKESKLLKENIKTTSYLYSPIQKIVPALIPMIVQTKVLERFYNSKEMEQAKSYFSF